MDGKDANREKGEVMGAKACMWCGEMSHDCDSPNECSLFRDNKRLFDENEQLRVEHKSMKDQWGGLRSGIETLKVENAKLREEIKECLTWREKSLQTARMFTLDKSVIEAMEADIARAKSLLK